MKLPEVLEKEYERALEEYKQLKRSPFISAAECIGLRQGLLEGYQEGLAEGRAAGLAEGRAAGLAEGIRVAIISVLRRKHGDLVDSLIPALTTILDPTALERLHETR